MGIDAHQKINLHDPAVLTSLMKAMMKQEVGCMPYSEDVVRWAANTAINPSTAGAPPASGTHVTAVEAPPPTPNAGKHSGQAVAV